MSFPLSLFQRPSRYIGNEFNVIRKDADIRVALCFPDAYEIGMSHLGLKVLYAIINNIPCASAERVFAPWIDYESFLREKNLPLTSLENNRPLAHFDIVGFTLQYELSYTNVLNMLSLGSIPLRAEERGNSYPLILAGGPCTVNPLPMAPFIDAFVIGDGEEVIKEIIETFSVHRSGRRYGSMHKVADKNSLLRDLSSLEGVYVPLFHPSNGRRIRRRIVKDLDQVPFPDTPIVPFTPPVHDRVAIEISRGCSRGCRFCQAGIIYRPTRERSVETVLSLSGRSLATTGYDEISFTSLSTGDYPNLASLIKRFNNSCSGKNIAISLPSLRVDTVCTDVLRQIKRIRKTGFTIAPEAGTARLRNVINKDLSEEAYENTLDRLFSEGWQKVKLYFMIGLPTERREDIDAIVRSAEKAVQKGKKITGRHVDINVGISAFVPKTHTPFQWFGQMHCPELRTRQEMLRKAFKIKGIHLKGQQIELSILEAVLSRGNSDCAGLLEAAWKRGCRFDGWSEVFCFDAWLAASEAAGIDLFEYASRTFDLQDALPWEFIDTGVTEEFLTAEYRKAMDEEITKDCRRSCSGCGLQCKTEAQEQSGPPDDPAETDQNSIPVRFSFRTPGSTTRARIKFCKTGPMRYLSHREVVTALVRAIRRTGIPLAYSEGFHPHPKVSFGPPLPVGVEGTNEYFDMELDQPLHPYRIPPLINASLSPGLEITDAAIVSRDSKSLNDLISRYEYEMIIDRGMHEAVHSFVGLSSFHVSREKKIVDIRPMVEKADVDGIYLHLTLVESHPHRIRLYELLGGLFQKKAEEIQALPIRRVRMYGRGKDGWTDPMAESENVWTMRSS